MKSILGKLWLGITSLVIIIIILIWVFQVFFLNRYYIQERTRILQNEGEKIAYLVEKSESIYDIPEEVINEIESFKSSFRVNIYAISTSLEPLFERDTLMSIVKRLELHRDTDVASDIKEGRSFVKHRVGQQESIYITVGVPLRYNDRLIGSIVLETSVLPIQETIAILKQQLTLITLLSIAIGTLLSLLLAKVFTKPIIKIIHAAKRITKGDFGTKVYIASQDEIGMLGDTINNLSTQLGQTEKFRREFIANTTHEFKTPISLIKAYAELIKEWDEDQKENVDQHLDVIIEESDRLNTMVEDMLYLSKMEAGYYKPKMESFNIVEIAEEVIEKLAHIANENNINITLNASPSKISVKGDENEIQHVLLNLVSNAIIHSSTSDEISVKVTANAAGTRIEVTDNGVGIPSEDLPYIWDRFYKVDKSRQRTNSGTGLGMSIVKNILEAHGFEYGIESKLGEGTTVWFESRDE